MDGSWGQWEMEDRGQLGVRRWGGGSGIRGTGDSE